MFRFKPIAILLAAALAVAPFTQASAGPEEKANAERAYADLLGQFWAGAPNAGHLVLHGLHTNVPPSPKEHMRKGQFWEYGQGVNVLYNWWKLTGSADARTRLAAHWAWTKTVWTPADFAGCGPGSTSTDQDDATWGSAALLEIAEATGDAAALSGAKAMLDCAWNRWHDTQFGGGLWYGDSHKGKSSHNALYAVNLLRYSQMSGDKTYLERARAQAAWAAATLRRAGQNVGGYVNPTDGIYWQNIAPDGRPKGWEKPLNIHPTRSVTMLEGNMAWAVLDARLFALTGDPTYKARAIATAAGIEARETWPGRILVNDRDPNVDGFAAVAYAQDVVPLLPPHGTADAATLRATARAAAQLARRPDGTYSADWQPDGDRPWENKGEGLGVILKISAQAVDFIQAGYAVSR